VPLFILREVFKIERKVLAAAKTTIKSNDNYRVFQFALPQQLHLDMPFVKNIEFRLVAQLIT